MSLGADNAALREEIEALQKRVNLLEGTIGQLKKALKQIANETFLAQCLDEEMASLDQQVDEWRRLANHRQQLARAALYALKEEGSDAE